MKSTQFMVAFALIVLAQPDMAAGQGKGPPAGDVNVVNTPDVNVANAPDVVVMNTPSNPVPTMEIGAKDYVHIHDVTLIGTGDTGFSAFGFGKEIYTVPTGKRLIIETVSPSVSDIEGVNFDVTLRPGDSAGGFNFALVTKGVYAAGTIPEKGRDALTVSAKLVVGSDVELMYQMIRDVTTSTEVAGTSITVIGYLEDMP